MPSSPNIICPELPALEVATELQAVFAAFQTAPACRLQQAWLPKPEPRFAPGTVRLGWRDDTLHVLAELHDRDIFTFARHHNERLWELGDTLEIFLRPQNQAAYGEFHIAPNNLRLQLRFADASDVEQARKDGSFAARLVQASGFNSRTWVRPDLGRWYAFAQIPAASVIGAPAPLPGSEWRFSCCRYDYTRGFPEPVISSISTHSLPDFHRLEEWGTLRFETKQSLYETASCANLAGKSG